MSIDKVQLQQQEVVNNEVVLTDINPVTSTNAVFDASTGSTMQETLDRLWNAINSELARIVNSVNNRTGAVVLNSADVGLGNVDNVSFNDIKNWVIEYFKEKMSNFHYRLFDTLQEALNLQQTNDESLDGVPFFAKVGLGADKLSYVGYYYWNEGTSELEINYKAINVVGEVDNSIIYNEVVGDKNYSGGRLGVNIHPDEDALYVENGLTKAQSGLRIHPDKFASKLVESKCLYGDVNATNAMLSANDSSDGAPIRIFIDGEEITSTHGHHLHKNWSETLSRFNLVLTAFGPYYTISSTPGVAPVLKGPNATFDLMGRQPAIGVVTHIPTDVSDPYIIEFNTIKTFTSGFGVKYYENHQDLADAHDSQLGIHLTNQSKVGNVSGIQAAGTGLRIDDPNEGQSSPYYPYLVTLPCGWINTKNGVVDDCGAIVTTDDSICRYPVHMGVPAAANVNDTSETIYDGKYLGSKMSDNWAPIAYWGYDVNAGTVNAEPWLGDIKADGNYNNLPASTSYLSVNMNKLIRDTGFTLLTEQPTDWNLNWRLYYTRSQVSETINDYIYIPNSNKYDSKPEWESGKFYKEGTTVTVGGVVYRTDMPRYHFTNVSGLKNTHLTPERVYEYNDHDLTKDEKESLGIFDDKDSLGNDLTFYPFENFSGGLAVNVGNFLEICPKETSGGGDYDESGKVQVRIGPGLTDDFSYEEIDTTTIISAPDDYYTHPERFRLLKTNGELVPLDTGFTLLTGTAENDYGKPVDWDTTWRKYYQLYNDIYVPTIAFHHMECQYQPNVFYRYGQPGWDDILNYLNTNTYKAVCRIYRTNRIRVDVDNKTVFIGNDNKLSVKSGVEKFDEVNGRYKKGQLIYSKMNGANILLLVDSDFNVDGAHPVNYYITAGKLKYMTYMPDGSSIKMYNGFLKSVTNIDIYEANKDYTEGQIIQTNSGKALYRVIDDFNSGDRDIRYWLTEDKLSQVTYDVDNETLEVSNGSIKTKATIIREWEEDEFFYGREMITNESHSKVYMVIPEEGYTASDSISTDVSNGKLLALN